MNSNKNDRGTHSLRDIAGSSRGIVFSAEPIGQEEIDRLTAPFGWGQSMGSLSEQGRAQGQREELRDPLHPGNVRLQLALKSYEDLSTRDADLYTFATTDGQL